MKILPKKLKLRYTLPCLFLAIIAFTVVDGVLIKNGSSPIFVLHVNTYKDGGSKKLIGFGYSIKAHQEEYLIDPQGINESWAYKGYSFKHWILPISYSKVTPQRRD